ncbi:hypothetical protein Bca4012_070378 [Brassica carinata]
MRPQPQIIQATRVRLNISTEDCKISVATRQWETKLTEIFVASDLCVSADRMARISVSAYEQCWARAAESLSTKAHASSDNKKLYVENVNCSSKVTIIGSSLGIGPALSTSLKKSPLKLFGLMTPETELARAFVAERFVLYVEDVHVPVIGGHCSLTALPLFSKTTPHVILYKDDIILWTSEITYSINNSSEYLDYFAGNPDREFFEARGAERFVLSLLRALGGANDMFQCCFVESNMFEDIPFFGSTVKLGKKGVEAIN